VRRLLQQEVVRYTRENADSGDGVVILQMSCYYGGEPVEFVSVYCLEARLIYINFLFIYYR
jgi:hypothetical protein